MWYFTRVRRWLRDRPRSLMRWPVALAVAGGALAGLVFEFLLVRQFPDVSPVIGALATAGFFAVVAGVVAFISMRLYVELLRHTVDQAEERLRLTDQLAQERLMMRALMDHSPDHIYFKDRASRFLRINRSQAAFFGLDDPARAVGRTDFDIFSAEHAQQAFDDEQSILRTGQPMRNKVEKETWPDGRVTWASTSKLPLRDNRGEIIGTFGISRDVTEQVLRDLQVRQLSLAVEQSPDVVLVTDVEGRITYVNPRFTEVTGYTPLEAVGQNPRLLKSGRTPPSVYEELWRTIQSGRTWAGELVNRRKNGELYWSRLLVAPLRDDQGQIIQFVAVSEDVTARKEAEAARQAMLDGLRAVLEMADELIGCADMDEVYRRAVELPREKLGLDRVALSLVRDGRAQSIYGTNLRGETTDERAFAQEVPPDWEAQFQARAAGGPRWRATAGPLYEWDGQTRRPAGQGPLVTTPIQTPARTLGMLCNDFARRGGEPDPVRQEVVAVYAGLLAHIIARKQAEAEQRALEARQRDWMERTDRLNSLGLLAAGMAHEINNPLQGMLSHLHAVEREVDERFAGRESLAMVGRGIETIAGLVRKLLVMGAGGEAGEGTAECGECVDFVAQLLESQIRKARVTLVRASMGGRLVVRLPRRELCQVLMNLLINARDAMPEGGTITIEGRRVGDEAVLSIRDTGQGIAPEHLGRLFTPFFTTKGGRGTGLGLSVADSLVRGAGGRIEVESQLGRGSVFALHLPLAGG